MPPSPEDRRRKFVVAHTRLRPVPGVPPLRLYLADELTPIWEWTEEELGEAGVDPPYWSFAWAGGQALARYVLENPAEVRGRRVLDLAAGSGVAGIAAALAGAGSVVAADVDAFAAAAAELNAEANGVSVTTRTDDLLAGGPVNDADVVLAGDVCYEHAMAGRMVSWLRAMAAGGARVLVGDPGRRYLPADGLAALASYRLPTSPEVEEAEWRCATVFRLGA